jgi:hypothetical protein
VVLLLLGIRLVSVRLRADEAGLMFANVIRTHRIPWREVQAFQCQRKHPAMNLGLGLGGEIVACRTKDEWIEINATHASSWLDTLDDGTDGLWSAKWCEELERVRALADG